MLTVDYNFTVILILDSASDQILKLIGYPTITVSSSEGDWPDIDKNFVNFQAMITTFEIGDPVQKIFGYSFLAQVKLCLQQQHIQFNSK